MDDEERERRRAERELERQAVNELIDPIIEHQAKLASFTDVLGENKGAHQAAGRVMSWATAKLERLDQQDRAEAPKEQEVAPVIIPVLASADAVRELLASWDQDESRTNAIEVPSRELAAPDSKKDQGS